MRAIGRRPGMGRFEVVAVQPPPGSAANGIGAVGRISVGEFSEHFPMDLSYWDVDDYRASWARALRVVDGRDEATSCLVSSISDPATANFVFCWPVYRSGPDVRIQNSVVFLDELTEPFRPDEPWRSVGPRSTVDEDGNQVSEWQTDISAVRRFLTAVT
ncbi:hypothetical protein [Streptomyces sp. NPDC029674]|uniref:hypothetical protein n=1 Tax=Streptomyces sp. NPDC029674 TaxID=3365297 RepID=UPI00384F9A4C